LNEDQEASIFDLVMYLNEACDDGADMSEVLDHVQEWADEQKLLRVERMVSANDPD
jgi:hypothetical protein